MAWQQAATSFAALTLLLVLLTQPLQNVHAVGDSGAAASFNNWVEENQLSYAANMALYAQKSAGKANEPPDAALVAAEAKKVSYVVDPSGKGDDTKLTTALERAVPVGNTRRVILKLKPGVYREKLFIDDTRKPFVTFKSFDPTQP